jgi:SAM-dependent methyltransferase
MADSIDWDRVAELYDTYAHATYDIPFFVEEVGKESGSVLELMAGTGRVSIPLLEAGANLACVDRSHEMLARLRRKLEGRHLQARVYEMDICDLALPDRFDLIILPFHSFCEIVDPDDRKRALARIFDHLREGGRFICTLTNPTLRVRALDGQLRLSGSYPLAENRGTLVFFRAETRDEGSPIAHALQFYEQYDQAGILRDKSMLEVAFALIAREEFEASAERAGFHVTAFYGDYSRSPFQAESSGFMIWILSK